MKYGILMVLLLFMTGQCCAGPSYIPPSDPGNSLDAGEIWLQEGLPEGTPFIVFDSGYTHASKPKSLTQMGGMGERHPLEPEIVLAGGEKLNLRDAVPGSVHQKDKGYQAVILRNEDGGPDTVTYNLRYFNLTGSMLGADGWNLSAIATSQPLEEVAEGRNLEELFNHRFQDYRLRPITLTMRVSERVGAFVIPEVNIYNLDGGEITFIAWREDGDQTEVYPQPAGQVKTWKQVGEDETYGFVVVLGDQR